MLSGLISSIKSAGKRLDNMEDLMLEELRDIYDAEEQIIVALPKMIDAASDARLKTAFRKHLEVTKRQRDRLKRIFDKLGKEAKGTTCDGIRGIIVEGEVLAKADGDARVRDAALIAAAQRVEHYEVAAYGAVRTWANYLGRGDIAQILQETLDEEAQTDEALTQLALGDVNKRAASA